VDRNDGQRHQLGDEPSQQWSELTPQRAQPYGPRANGAASIPVGIQARERTLHDDRRMSQYGLPAKSADGRGERVDGKGADRPGVAVLSWGLKRGGGPT
jgi:hypothetical protein